MEKKKTNPFYIILILLALLIGGGLLAFGFMKKSEFGDTITTYRAKKQKVDKINALEGSPNKETVDTLESDVVRFKGKIEGLRTSIGSTTNVSLQKIPPAEFASNLERSATEVKAQYEGKGIELPENWNLGFEIYSAKIASAESTGELNYQLEASKWLHETLAKHSPLRLLNLHRSPTTTEDPAPSSSKRNKRNQPAAQYVSLPMEITFEAYEEDARAFINTLMSSTDYFFTVDSLKMKLLDPVVEAPEKEETSNNQPSEDLDFSQIFSGTEEGSEEEEEEVTLSDEKIIDIVLGQETVAVFLDLNLVYLIEEEEPKKKAGAKK